MRVEAAPLWANDAGSPIVLQRGIPHHILIRLSVGYFMLGFGALLYVPFAAPDEWWLHGLWCFAGLAIALPTLVRALSQGFTVVLTEHVLMFLASFSLYFLFGASLLAVGPDVQTDRSLEYYPIDASAALRVDAINGMGFGIALLMAAVAPAGWLGRQADKAALRAARIPVHVVTGLFLAVGAVASLHRFAVMLGVAPSNVSGSVRTAAQFSLVAVFLAAAHRGSGERVVRAAGVVLAVLLAIVGLLEFAKSAALFPMAALVAGLALRFGSRRILPVGLTLIVASYLALGNLVSYGRAVVGAGGAATMAERWQVIEEGRVDTRDLSEEDEYSAWGRLCYVPSSAAGLDLYDAGQGGDGLALIPWVFLPRVLFPEKPDITKTGAELHTKISGGTGSGTGQGIFASGYHHAGWWGLVLASALCGWILAQTSAIARSVQDSGGLLMLPFSLMGLLIAFRIDGDFVADYLGAFVFVLYPVLAATLLLPAKRKAHDVVGRQISR